MFNTEENTEEFGRSTALCILFQDIQLYICGNLKIKPTYFWKGYKN